MRCYLLLPLYAALACGAVQAADVLIDYGQPEVRPPAKDDYCTTCHTCDPCSCVATPWHPCGNLFPHYPYEAWPRTYYYFRPYNYRHVWVQSEQAAKWGATRSQPYARQLFEEVYSRFELR